MLPQSIFELGGDGVACQWTGGASMQAPKRERSGTIVPGTTRNQDALRIAPGRCSGPALISAGQAQSRPDLPLTVENTAPSAGDIPVMQLRKALVITLIAAAQHYTSNSSSSSVEKK
jgi:hypothetical protein